MRGPLLALTLAACTRASVVTPERDPTDMVFGDPSWRVPGTIAHLAFERDTIDATTEEGARFAFAADGARRDLAAAPAAERSGGRRAIDGGLTVRGGDIGTPLVVDRGGTTITLEQSRHYEQPRIVGDWVVATRAQQTVAIWDATTGTRHRVFALGNGGAFALSPDRTLLAAGTFRDGDTWAVDVYRVEDGARVTSIGFACNPNEAAFAPHSDQLAIACDDEVRVVKVPGGEPVAQLAAPRGYPLVLAWSPTADRLALAAGDNVLHLWRTSDWQQQTRVTGSRGEIRELALHGDVLVSRAAGDRSAWLWSTETARPLVELGSSERDIYAVATDGDRTQIAVGNRTASETVIERWRGTTKLDHVVVPSSLGLAALVRNLGPVAAGVWYTAEGRLHVLGRDLEEVWATAAPATEGELALPDAVAVATPDGHRVAMYGSDTLTIADAIEHRIIAQAQLACGGELAISPDGGRVALLDGRGVTVLDTDSARVVGSLALPSKDYVPRALAWSGRDVVTAAVEGKLVAWTPGAPAADVMPAPGATSLAISADHVYIGRSDGTVARRSLTALRKTATALPAHPAAACVEAPARAGMLRGIGGLFGGEEPRGRLPDDGHYDDDER